MKKSAITSSAEILGIQRVLYNLKDISPETYVFFSLIFLYGLKQEDIFNMSVEDLFSSELSEKYPDIDLSTCDLLDEIPLKDRSKTFREILPSRDYLFKLLNKAARIDGYPNSLNVSILQKTWAYTALQKGKSASSVMSHFSYKNSTYKFLTEFLGLDFYDCCDNKYLGNLYAKACFSELAKLDYTLFSEEKQSEFLDLLFRILNLVNLLEQ